MKLTIRVHEDGSYALSAENAEGEEFQLPDDTEFHSFVSSPMALGVERITEIEIPGYKLVPSDNVEVDVEQLADVLGCDFLPTVDDEGRVSYLRECIARASS